MLKTVRFFYLCGKPLSERTPLGWRPAEYDSSTKVVIGTHGKGGIAMRNRGRSSLVLSRAALVLLLFGLMPTAAAPPVCVVRAPPQQGMGTMAGEELRDKTEPIEVGNHPGEGHQRAIARRQRHHGREGLPQERVGERMHGRSSSGFGGHPPCVPRGM